MANSKVTKAKGKSPDNYKPNNSYTIGVKGEDETLGFYSEHMLGEKSYLKVASRGSGHRTTRAQVHEIINELKGKWPNNTYTIFKTI